MSDKLVTPGHDGGDGPSISMVTLAPRDRGWMLTLVSFLANVMIGCAQLIVLSRYDTVEGEDPEGNTIEQPVSWPFMSRRFQSVKGQVDQGVKDLAGTLEQEGMDIMRSKLRL